MDVAELNGRVQKTIDEAQGQIKKEFEGDDRTAFIRTFDGEPGVWETAEAIGIVRWRSQDLRRLRSAVDWLVAQQHEEEGGFPASPDISTRAPYTESTSRVLLSLAPCYRVLGEPSGLRRAILRAVDWLLEHQDEESGGWGSRTPYRPRSNPTAFAMQALHESVRSLERIERADEIRGALDRAAQWFLDTAAKRGGNGLTAGASRNACSSGHAAWALAGTGRAVPEALAAYLRQSVESTDLPDVDDPIEDEPAEKVGGRFKLLLLGRPLGLIGVLSAGSDAYASYVVKLVEEILESAKDGLWYVEDGRYVWPTYFNVCALRLWSNIHAAHASTITVDLSHVYRAFGPPPSFGMGSGASRAADDQALLAKAKLADRLTNREKQVLPFIVGGASNDAIRRSLDISKKTVEVHKSRIYAKLETRDRSEIQQIAVLAGLVEQDPGA